MLKRKLLKTFLADILFSGSIVCGDYLYNYKIPQKLPSLNITASSAQSNDNSTYTDWSVKFQDHFSDSVISTDTTYKSPNISIELTQNSYDTNMIDFSEGGKHTKYGTKVSYTLADIYIRSIDCFKTAFAQDTYGTGYSETLSSMSSRIQSIIGINGDSYSNNRHQNNGTIIRNGIVYRSQPSTEETCVLFQDGTMKIYAPDSFNVQDLITNGAWQSWVFGPSLLDENGNAKSDFLTWSYIRESHPRTAIGYYEPGHYCLLVVDGRQSDYSRGMFLEEMSKLFADLGCKAAYNLDGGHCSFMSMQDNIISHPYKPQKEISDGIFICETEA